MAEELEVESSETSFRVSVRGLPQNVVLLVWGVLPRSEVHRDGMSVEIGALTSDDPGAHLSKELALESTEENGVKLRYVSLTFRCSLLAEHRSAVVVVELWPTSDVSKQQAIESTLSANEAQPLEVITNVVVKRSAS